MTEARRIPYMNLSDDVNETGYTHEMAYNLSIVRDDDKLQHYLHEINHNLSKPQKKVKLWHCRLGHAGFSWIQDLMRTKKENVGDPSQPPVLTVSNPTTLSCAHPKCAACFFAKQHRHTPQSVTISTKPEREMAIRRDAMCPGAGISIDQYHSNPGCLPFTYGKEKTEMKYNSGSIFIDHYSAFIHLNHQVSLQTGETLKAKHEFECFAALHGVKLQRF